MSREKMPPDVARRYGIPRQDSVRPLRRGEEHDGSDTPTLPTLPTPALIGEESDALRFPVEALPAAFGRVVAEGSASVGCAPEMIGVPGLSALGSALGGARVVQIKRGWTEGTALWTGVVAASGEKKSPGFSIACAPVWARQALLRAAFERALEEHKAAVRAHKAGLRTLDKGETEPPPPEPPKEEICVTDDHTMEALGQILADNPRGVLNVRDELPAVVTGLNQYKGGKGSDREALLKIHSSSPIKIDRVGRSIMVAKPVMGVTGGVQPAKLHLIYEGRDGLAERFLLARPEVRRGGATREELSEDAEEGYVGLYDALCRLEMPVDDEGRPYPRKVPVSDEAFELFLARSAELADEVSHPGFPAAMEGTWGKMEAHLARLALLLCLCRRVEQGISATREEVLVEDLDNAWRLVRYFCAHALRIAQALPLSQIDDLEHDVLAITHERGGTIEASATELYDLLEARGSADLPGDGKQLSVDLERIAQRSPRLKFDRGYRGKGRVLRIRLVKNLSQLVESPGVHPGKEGRRETRNAYGAGVGSVGSVGGGCAPVTRNRDNPTPVTRVTDATPVVPVTDNHHETPNTNGRGKCRHELPPGECAVCSGYVRGLIEGNDKEDD